MYVVPERVVCDLFWSLLQLKREKAIDLFPPLPRLVWQSAALDGGGEKWQVASIDRANLYYYYTKGASEQRRGEERRPPFLAAQSKGIAQGRFVTHLKKVTGSILYIPSIVQ